MKLSGKYSIACDRCGKTYDYMPDDVMFTETGEKDAEGNKWYVWEKDFDCVKCGNPIHIKYEVCLSPDDRVIEKKVDVKGAKQLDDSFKFF